MKKQGFTLVELLAVLVVLALLSVIIVPQILDTVESSREGAWKDSAKGLLEAAELYYTDYAGEELRIDLSDPKHIQELDYKGKAPKSGMLYITGTGKMALEMYNGKYCAVKSFKSREVSIHKVVDNQCSYILEDGNVESTSGTLLTLNNTVETTIGNYTIHGKTNQVIKPSQNYFNYLDTTKYGQVTPVSRTLLNDTSAFTGKTMKVVYTTVNASGNHGTYATSRTKELEVGKQYTWSVRLKASKQASYRVGQEQGGVKTITVTTSYQTFTHTFTATENQYKAFVFYTSTPAEGDELYIQDLQLVEGTSIPYGYVSNTTDAMPSPTYPSSLKSLGRYNEKTKKYEIDVVVESKNLFNYQQWLENDFKSAGVFRGIYASSDNESFTLTSSGADCYTNTHHMQTNPSDAAINLIKKFGFQVEAKKEYTLSFSRTGSTQVQGYVSFYDEEYRYLGLTSVTSTSQNVSKTFTTPDHTTYIAIRFDNDVSGQTIKYFNFSLVTGSTTPTYQKNQKKIYTIELDAPLRSIGNVSDTIDFKTGTVTRRVGETQYKGTETVSKWGRTPKDGFAAVYILTNAAAKSPLNQINSNYFVYNSATGSKQGVSFYAPNGGIHFTFPTSKFADGTAFKNWIGSKASSETPLTVHYQLPTNQVEKIALPAINTLNQTTTLYATDGTNIASMDAQYAVN